MALIHKLNDTVIDEPVGFDNLEVSIERGDYHGVSVEASVGTIKFYNEAYEIIKTAYDAGLDTEVRYVVVEDGTTIYTGIVDLSTCSFVDAAYRSVSVKVGDIGAKTTFNNRSDVDVNLETEKTIDGAPIAPATWESINVPTRHLMYTDAFSQGSDKSIDIKLEEGRQYVYYFVKIPMEVVADEFGDCDGDVAETAETADVCPHYQPGGEFVSKYGNNTVMSVRCKGSVVIHNEYLDQRETKVQLILLKKHEGGGNNIAASEFGYLNWTGATFVKQDHTFNFDWDAGNINANESVSLLLCIMPTRYIKEGHVDKDFVVTVKAGTMLKLKMYDNIPETTSNTKMLFVHDALNVVSRAISENAIKVKSDYYGRPDSQFFPTESNGGGALRCITNGYKIRDLFTDANNERNMPLSFKTAIESLNALDCIGWGFSEESGNTCVRVERWDWFYKENVVLKLSDVAEVTTEMSPDDVVTVFEIGYKKYETNDNFNSIDSVHGTRKYTSTIKAVSNEKSVLCEFIADNYAIEITRRLRGSTDNSESSYDESVFVFVIEQNGTTYSVARGAVSATGIERKGEQINMAITPRRCAERWQNILFTATSAVPLKFTTGEINYKAAIKLTEETSLLAENSDIAYKKAMFRAETISFKSPISHQQYKDVLASPYGLVEVNGKSGWIKSLKYNLSNGMAEFKLITKTITKIPITI